MIEQKVNYTIGYLKLTVSSYADWQLFFFDYFIEY